MSADNNLPPSSVSAAPENIWALFLIFLRLGLTSFGGPIAHLSYFREEFVARRRWLSEQSYADLVALCQFLPGPASSQVGMAIGLFRHGVGGALVAWAGFTLPSAFALMLFATGISHDGDLLTPAALHGLKVAAVAVVAQAVWGMARSICTDRARIAMTRVAACACLMLSGPIAQIAVIIVAAVVGMALFSTASPVPRDALPVGVTPRAGLIWLTIFGVLLVALPLLSHLAPSQTIRDIDAFFRVGSLVFGGGHVVLPLLQAEVVPNGLVSNDTFLAGYGAAQAVPGPLFTFAAFLGASMSSGPNGLAGGMLCLIAIFAPSFFMVAGTIPFWDSLRKNLRMQAALAGVNAAVVGLLLAALYNPVWTSAILRPIDFALAVAAFSALTFWKTPPWLVVLGCALASAAMG